MRVCIDKSTGKLIEMQSDAIAGTLILNAINAGFAEPDIEEKEVTQEEWQAIQDAQPKPEPPILLEDVIADLLQMLADKGAIY
jgi:hypothetical protein